MGMYTSRVPSLATVQVYRGLSSVADAHKDDDVLALNGSRTARWVDGGGDVAARESCRVRSLDWMR